MEQTVKTDVGSYIRKKFLLETVFRYGLIAYALVWTVVSAVLLSQYTNKKLALVIVLTTPLWVGAVLYFTYFYPCYRNNRWLDKIGAADAAQDIRPTKAGITYGAKALLCVKPYAVVPYAQIAWAYLDHAYDDYGKVLSSDVILYCKDGKRFRLPATSAEQDYKRIQTLAPHIISGAGGKSKAQYLKACPDVDRTRRLFWGSGLLTLACLLLGMSIWFGSVAWLGVAMLASLFVAGIVLIVRMPKGSNQKID